MTDPSTYRPQAPPRSPSSRKFLLPVAFCFLLAACGEIPPPTVTGDTTLVDSFDFSIVVSDSLVGSGWNVREHAYSPSLTQQYRSVHIPIVYELFVDRPAFNGRMFQPLDQFGPRIERGLRATRVVVRVLEFPPGIPSFEALVDTVRNLNQTVTNVVLNGRTGRELSLSGGNSNDPVIYEWPHAVEMVPRMIFQGDRFLYFVNTFESRGNNPDTMQVASVVGSLRIGN